MRKMYLIMAVLALFVFASAEQAELPKDAKGIAPVMVSQPADNPVADNVTNPQQAEVSNANLPQCHATENALNKAGDKCCSNSQMNSKDCCKGDKTKCTHSGSCTDKCDHSKCTKDCKGKCGKDCCKGSGGTGGCSGHHGSGGGCHGGK